MTLVEGLRRWALEAPERLACTFVTDTGEEQTLTYGELDLRARTVAATLTDSGAAGERVLLLYPPGLDYVAAFFGCLYAGVVAVPLYPPDPTRIDRTLSRLQAIVRDAQPALALTTTPIRALAKAMLARAPELADVRWLATDAIDPVVGERYQPCIWAPDRLAFLQYTSGSTGQPKGVMLTHDHLLSNIGAIVRSFRMRPDDRVVSWLPPYHDMGLIGTILLPLHVGAQVILLSPIAFLRKPRQWLEAVTRHRATIAGAPNFGFALCTRKVPADQREGLDLSSLQVMFVGAEPIRAAALEAFTEAFAPHGFRPSAYLPCYGLAEATLLVTGSTVEGPLRGGGYRTVVVDKAEYERGRVSPVAANAPGVSLVGSGEPPLGVEVRIVDPQTRRPARAGAVGEVWVGGGSVAHGYWDREHDPEVFGARLELDPSTDDPHAGLDFFRTGDLGFVRGRELFICGRSKDLIVINGRNLHPQDIELVAESSHDQLRPGCCAALSVNDGERERLVVVIEVTTTDAGQLRRDEVHRAVLGAVSREHGLRVDELVLLPRSTIPKTSSGKIQRRACRAALLDDTLPRLPDPPE